MNPAPVGGVSGVNLFTERQTKWGDGKSSSDTHTLSPSMRGILISDHNKTLAYSYLDLQKNAE